MLVQKLQEYSNINPTVTDYQSFYVVATFFVNVFPDNVRIMFWFRRLAAQLHKYLEDNFKSKSRANIGNI